ncbi:MAG: glycoside hydrolase family 127 protein [Acidobacteria bacterium]|nr:glycoside hydrolase family 127 protein [Acidobacteriota bacterium]
MRNMTRREMLGSAGKAAATSVALSCLTQNLFVSGLIAADPTNLDAAAGPDRIAVLPGKTYLIGWAGFGEREMNAPAPEQPGPPPANLEFYMAQGSNPRSRVFFLSQATSAESSAIWLSVRLERTWGGSSAGRILTASIDAATLSPGKYHAAITIKMPDADMPLQTINVDLQITAATYVWSKQSGPGSVKFADPEAMVTSAGFSVPGNYVLALTVKSGETTASSSFNVTVETPPPPKQLDAIYTKDFKINSPLWSARAKALIVNWIPHCIDQINRTDLKQGQGGIDNFIEAAKALRGEPHGTHKGYVFSNAWIHQTVESMCIALMIDPQGDPEILKAHEKMGATLEDWIPKILAAQHPDGYLQTAFTLRDVKIWPDRWTPQGRGNHEGYVAGYFIESAINHYLMTKKKDARLYNAAKTLADCWCDNLGPAPKKEWFDGHQEMEQALVRFGRFVNDMEGGGKGDRYIQLAKFLLDCRRNGSEYDQSHLPVIQQYEAVGHAVRAVYTYSGMADVAVETHDPDYQSAVKSLWNNMVQKKYYLTGGVGSGETSEGFGPNYSLGNDSYCEACSSCGAIFFHWKMNLMNHDARYADQYELAMYNALLGSIDQEGRNFYYDNPLSSRVSRYPWHTCPCCVGNIPRTLLMMPTWMYAKDADGIYVNLFVGSTINVEDVGGVDVEMVQDTNYPWDGHVSIMVNPKTAARFSVRVRVPNRDISVLYKNSPEVNQIVSLSVNGSPVEPAIHKGYAVITRTWNRGDKIDLVLPLKVQRVKAIDKIEANRGKVALRYGPLVYNIEQVDQDIAKALSPSAPLTTEWKPDLLGGVVVIKGQFSDGSPMTAIPNFARTNRDPASPAEQRAKLPPPVSIVWITEG